MEFKHKGNNFSIEIKCNDTNEDQEKLVNALGNIIVSNMSLINTDLINTCRNLLHIYSEKLLENIADYMSINGIECPSNIKSILDEFSTVTNFSSDYGDK